MEMDYLKTGNGNRNKKQIPGNGNEMEIDYLETGNGNGNKYQEIEMKWKSITLKQETEMETKEQIPGNENEMDIDYLERGNGNGNKKTNTRKRKRNGHRLPGNRKWKWKQKNKYQEMETKWELITWKQKLYRNQIWKQKLYRNQIWKRKQTSSLVKPQWEIFSVNYPSSWKKGSQGYTSCL